MRVRVGEEYETECEKKTKHPKQIRSPIERRKYEATTRSTL